MDILLIFLTIVLSKSNHLNEVKNKIKGFLFLDLVTGDPPQQKRSLIIEIEEELKNITKG